MSRVRGFPEDSELVVCTVKNVKNFGAFVTLDEYDDKEGFVHVRDVTTGWVKYIRDFIREGQKVVCKVLGVDSSKGHIDLSLKSVNEHQKREKIQQWKNEKKAEKLMEIIAERMSISIDEVYDLFGNDVLDAYETLYGAFETVAASADEFRTEFSGDWVDVFVNVAVENVTLSYVQIEGILELRSSAPDGVERIINAMKKGEKVAEDANADVTIQYVGAPRYRVVITADEYKEAEDIMKLVSSAVIDDLVKAGGEASLKRESK
jgi:translation initiation factor 2 subunit 1